MRPLSRYLLGVVLILGIGTNLQSADPPKADDKKPDLPDLSDFRNVENAIVTRISKASPVSAGQPGYLGVHLAPDAKGKLTFADVEADSPAAKAGLQPGDLLVALGGQNIASVEAFREALQSRSPGDTVKVALVRQDKPMEVTATLAAVSRPMKLTAQRAILGVQVGEPKEGEGVPITQITNGSPAEKAKLKVGEVILKIDGTPITEAGKLRAVIGEKKPGDTVTLTLLLAEKAVDLKVQLAADEETQGRGGRGGWDNRLSGYWRKDVYRLAVVCVEYPDVKHNAKVALTDWEEALFSRSTYVNKKSVTGQQVHGSLNDYYQEQSYATLRVEGKVFDWVQVSKKRADYEGTGNNNKSALLTEALDKVLARDGKEALKDFDGIEYLYAGERFQTNRGGLYWPHRASVTHQGKRWPYFIVPEGGGRMSDISVMCHEFGHMLGLPDLYARPENPGSTGLGAWCAMSNDVGGGRPQHFSAWCKEQLGWLKPAVIDPTVKQKLVLSPVEDSPKECLKVLIRLDGSEYLLLENRRKKGFDASLPGEGLLVWRIVNNKPMLEESHGIEGPSGPRVFPTAVPYPSTANNAFTPYTIPSSRSQLGGGLPVHITNIRRLTDGRITFYVGYEYE